MYLDTIISEAGKQLGMAALALDENKACSLNFDNKIDVHIELSEDQDTFFISSVVAAIYAGGEKELYERLLEGNFFMQGTGEAFFSIDRAAGEVMLQQRFSCSAIDVNGFLNSLDLFVTAVETWMEVLTTADPSGGPETSGDIPDFALRA